MSLAAKIRQYPSDWHIGLVAEELGCSREYVGQIRSAAKKPDMYLAIRAKENRASYHRTKVLGGPGEWTAEMDAELRLRLDRGQSFGTIAKAFGFSRSTIAGRVHRMRKA